MMHADNKVIPSDYYDIKWLLTIKREMIDMNNKTAYIMIS